MMCDIDEKPTTDIIFNGEKLKALPIRSETRQARPFFLLHFNTVIEDFARVLKQEKKISKLERRIKTNSTFG